MAPYREVVEACPTLAAPARGREPLRPGAQPGVSGPSGAARAPAALSRPLHSAQLWSCAGRRGCAGPLSGSPSGEDQIKRARHAQPVSSREPATPRTRGRECCHSPCGFAEDARNIRGAYRTPEIAYWNTACRLTMLISSRDIVLALRRTSTFKFGFYWTFLNSIEVQ